MSTIKFEDLVKILEKYEIAELENVVIEGDVEIEVPQGGGDTTALQIAIGQGAAQLGLSLMQFAQMLGYPVGAIMQPPGVTPPAPAEAKVLDKLIEAKFSVEPETYPTAIEEVTLGATRADGGTRETTVTLGGERALPFFNYAAKMPNPIAIAIDCFDMPIGLAKAVKVHYEDVMESPGEWAKKNVEKFGADMVTIHLISTDPLIKDTPAKEAAKVVEEVLQAVKVPIIIGGSGNPDKDPEVLEAAAEVAEGERCLIASANLNMDWERIAKAAMDHGHVILSWTQLDINNQKTLNRYLFKAGVKREDIVIDPTTAALGYGIDYAFTNIERMRIMALKGDTDLNFPISCGITNAWGAREAWMKESPLKEDSDWGPREYRGPLFEIVTGLTLGIAGGDLFMMMHPGAAATVKEITKTLAGAVESKPVPVDDWVTLEV
ncbi:MAG TPA: CO dehydrogenase/acetyl-CoA synthase subunit delta [Candidatus Syntrophoarchaeum butanivorans]|uniref:Acetyl-CoA decarbonylase/synthase complex subunit delta n=1 Tax=Candidatus Syntropharchaeum butanivorans TaxID=1839936 RepID=A0A1F2P3J6_9EURY|nr:MAG: acetyl-CoA decarbonylase/synthase complex delta subunit [Candidatus Syntrophoarchaeum butanivorans]HEC56725.1 CO dehydrogenase/acetyl-CoA synthase subunit delta [Candidatus Syntrophoarchaeum butanivorans]